MVNSFFCSFYSCNKLHINVERHKYEISLANHSTTNIFVLKNKQHSSTLVLAKKRRRWDIVYISTSLTCLVFLCDLFTNFLCNAVHISHAKEREKKISPQNRISLTIGIWNFFWVFMHSFLNCPSCKRHLSGDTLSGADTRWNVG